MRRWLVAIALAGLSCELAFADDLTKSAHCTGNRVEDYYPPKAIRLNHVGTVLVEYSVKAKGPPSNISVLRSTAPAEINQAAIRLIKLMQCEPDETWQTNGGPDKRLRMNVIFRLKGFDETPESIDPDADWVMITGSPIFTK